MEVRFENQFVMDEKMLREINTRISFVRRLLFMIFFGLMAIWYVREILLWGVTLLSGSMLAVCIGYIVWLIAEPSVYALRSINRTKKYHDGDNPAYFITCTDERIECRRGDACFSVPYHKIDKVHFYEHSIVVRAGKSTQVVLSQTGFTKGAKGEFVEFLWEKCPNLK